MFAESGFFLLLMCFLSSLYGFGASLISAKLRHRRLYRSSAQALIASAVMTTVACGLLLWMFYQRDYSVAYIFKNSSNDLPHLYTLTAFWSSLEGSHLLWTFLLVWVAVIALWTHVKDNEHIMPYVCASFHGVLCWMYYLTVSYSDPFVRQFPVMTNGQGMNALLQNPYMAIHPPCLFMGYTALAVPYAYGLAALCFGDVTAGWLKTVRRWTLIAWIFLTVGIFLGGRWAYVELGWAGYWAWDPVENSSFLPWLFTTAALHALIVQEKLGHLKRSAILLGQFAFFFSFFGTFITRSGVITSVHSFAQSPIGPNYLAFLGGLLGVSMLLYGWRAHSILPADAGKVWGVSRESALVVTQFLLTTFAAIVLIGTMYPIVSESLTGARFNVQAPYFNAFAPWLGICFVVAVALGNLLRYQPTPMVGSLKSHVIVLLVAIPLTLAFSYAGRVFESRPYELGAQLVGVYLCFWAAGCLVVDQLVKLKALRWSVNLMWMRNRASLGAFVAHIGMLVAILGFLGNYRGVDQTVTLKKGESTTLYGYEFQFNGVREYRLDNAWVYEAPLSVSTIGKDVGVVAAARNRYPTRPELMHEVGILEQFWHDIYVVLADFNEENHDQATLQIYINPTVRIVWISVVLMALGGLLAVFDPTRGERSRDALVA
ncbi:MAG: heme lyase CcmF/NrfE family subunit [Oligoflexales bacterium]